MKKKKKKRGGKKSSSSCSASKWLHGVYFEFLWRQNLVLGCTFCPEIELLMPLAFECTTKSYHRRINMKVIVARLK